MAGPPTLPDLETLNRQKVQLEIEDLRSRSRLRWKVLVVITPVIFPLLISVVALVVSWNTQGQQADLQNKQLSLQQTQIEMQKNNSEVEGMVRHREILNAVVQLATDEQPSRRIAGVLTLGEFWKEESDENTVASSLAAALISPGNQYAAVRCEAADAIGRAYIEQEGFRDNNPSPRIPRLAHLLYGTATGGMGIVIRQNLHLKDSGYKGSSNSVCTNELDATRQAIRTNWENLVAVNLKDTDLKYIQLYRADLLSTTFERADVAGADLACANLDNTNFERANWRQIGRLERANVANARPEEFRRWALAHGASEMGDDKWLDWRRTFFRVSADGNPVLSSALAKSTDHYCGAWIESKK